MATEMPAEARRTTTAGGRPPGPSLAHGTRPDAGPRRRGTGLNVGYLSQIENDKASPSLACLSSLAGALDVPIAWFLVDEARPPEVTRAADRRWREIARRAGQPGRRAAARATSRSSRSQVAPGEGDRRPHASGRRAPPDHGRSLPDDAGNARDRARTGRLPPLGRPDPARR